MPENDELKKYLDYDGLAYLLQRFPKTTVHCTFDDEFAGETATLTHGTTTYTKTIPATSPYELTFAVNELGTWTLQSSYLGTQYSDTVDITYLGQKGEIGLTIVPDGSTAEPVNSIPVWLKCANLNKSYTTLAEVLADTETYETLLADSNACQYMKRSTGWAGMTNLVPQMTGYTTPSGEVIYVGPGTGTSGNYPVWKAFDRNSSTDGAIAYNIGNSAGYHFTSPTVVNKIAMASTDSSTTTAFVFEGSNDNNTYTELLEFVGSNRTIKYYEFENETAYSYYRVRITNKTENWGDFGFQDLQFYKAGITTSQDAMARLGKFDYASNLLLSDSTWAEAIANSDYWNMVMENLVPKMTSDTAPSGECSLSSQYSTYAAYLAYDRDDSTASSTNSTQGVEHWSQYKSANPICAKRARLKFVTSNRTIVSCIIKGSNDGTNWTDIYSLTSSEIAELATGAYVNFPTNTTSYERHAVFATLNSAGVGISMYYIEFYGRASEEVLVPLVPTMTSNTTPSGVVSASSEYDGSYFPSWKAFNGTYSETNDCWASALNGNLPQWIQYEFTRKVVVNKFEMTNRNIAASGNSSPKDFELQASNDGSTWTTLGSYNNTNNDAAGKTNYEVSNNVAYKFYRLYITTMNGSQSYVCIGELQFYAKTVQTNIIHSTPNDTIYMLEDGDPIVLATTNSDGDGILDFSQLPAGPVTLYSSVAKSPEDLTADYSKTITITKTQYGGTTEAYLMPDTIKTLYWWGYEDENLEDCSTANGWVVGYTNYGFNAPTHNTNYIAAYSNHNNNTSAIGTKNAISGNKAHAVTQGIAQVSDIYCNFQAGNSKTLSQMDDRAYMHSSSMEYTELNLSDLSQRYIMLGTGATRKGDLYALWYE